MGILLTESEAAAAGSGTSMIVMLLVYAVLIGAMWFFFMRPQKKEQKRVAAMLSNLETGDCVLTTSGFYGIIIDITDDTVIVEFGNNKNCRTISFGVPSASFFPLFKSTTRSQYLLILPRSWLTKRMVFPIFLKSSNFL